MTFLRHRAALAAVLCSALAACDAGPTATDPSPLAPSAPVEMARVQCNVTVATGDMQCGDALSTGSARGLVVGNQGLRVRLAASNHTYDAQAETFSIDVTVQNLIGQALGTTDGSTMDSKGVMVFFQTEPFPTSGDMGGVVELAGNVHRDFLMQADQAYFQYNEVIQPNAVSAPVTWAMDLPAAVGSFGFTVYVMAAVQHPDGWVDLSVPQDTLLEGASTQVNAVVRNVYGDSVGGAVSWASSDLAVATIDNAGSLSALAPGWATVTATAGSRTGQLAFAVCPDLAVGEVYTAG
ncbi:Ig-like domain-containing protein, partial [Longimicrobium sp.]|uniref:Ig-like domain-containing protein n=1 Tax=Longimicrobium sp. TaxID=2029185 RepID=UPI002E30C952